MKIRAILLFEFTMNCKAVETTHISKHTMQLWLKKFAKDMRALKMSSVVPSHWKLTIAIESYHKSWSSYNYTRSCSITQHWPFYGDWHLKQIERWKISMSGCLLSWPKIKRSCHFEVSSFLSLHSNNELSRLNVTCDEKWILYDNQWCPAQWWPKKKSFKSSQSQICTKKGHGLCLVVCCPLDPWQLSESWWNHYIWEVCSANWWDGLKTAVPSACIGQQKGSNSPQCPTTCSRTKASKVEWIGLWSFICHVQLTSP